MQLDHYPLPKSSNIMMIGSLIMILISLGLSAYFFTGFIGDGRTGIGVLQAFLLCFSLGAIIYLPAAVLFFMARHVRGFGPKRSIGIAGVLISLPMWGFGATGLILKLPYWPYALLLLGFGLAILFWGVAVLKQATLS